jgi:hypothetical protein
MRPLPFSHECVGVGYTFRFEFVNYIAEDTPESSVVDVVVHLIPNKVVQCSVVSSVSAFISIRDLNRFSDYLVQNTGPDGPIVDYPFVSIELGFELTVYDSDEVEATIGLYVNMGSYEYDRIMYCGMRGRFGVDSIAEFSRNIRAVASEFIES